MDYIILFLISLAAGALVAYVILEPRLKKVEELNLQIKYENEIINNENEQLNKNKDDLKTEMKLLSLKKEEILNSIQELSEQAEKSNQIIYEKNYALMQENLSQQAEKLSKQFQQSSCEFEEEYLKVLATSSQEFTAIISEKQQELELVQGLLDEARAKATAAIEAQQREEEKQLELEKYKVLINELDLLEINRLREIAPYFRNARPIYKIIWESYYRNKTNDLISRVIGANTKIGIYKITNLKNNKSYIGQAVNISNRFKEHIKCGLGIDTPNNKLYQAMLEDGVENFSFEIVEECAREELNNREVYWIDFYQTQSYGYNMTKGGARK